MAQALEKIYRSKVTQMPKDEIKIDTSSGKAIKKKPKPPTGTLVGGILPLPAIAIAAATPAVGVGAGILNKVPSVKPAPNSISSSSNAQVSTILPPSENPNSGSGGISASTNKPIATANTNVQQNLHNLIIPQPTNTTQQLPTSSGSSFLVNQPLLSTVTLTSQQPVKVKKGVKRKADTTTPTGFNDPAYPSSADAKISTRGRQVI